jgi:hypothetical protein
MRRTSQLKRTHLSLRMTFRFVYFSFKVKSQLDATATDEKLNLFVKECCIANVQSVAKKSSTS